MGIAVGYYTRLYGYSNVYRNIWIEQSVQKYMDSAKCMRIAAVVAVVIVSGSLNQRQVWLSGADASRDTPNIRHT